MPKELAWWVAQGWATRGSKLQAPALRQPSAADAERKGALGASCACAEESEGRVGSASRTAAPAGEEVIRRAARRGDADSARAKTSRGRALRVLADAWAGLGCTGGHPLP